LYFFIIRRLKPGCQCQITISYVSELDLLHSIKKPTIRLTIPTTIAPRYSPSHGAISSPAGTQIEYVQSVPYTMEFTCQIEKHSQQISSVSSPSHPIKIDTTNENFFLITLSQQNTALEYKYL